MFVCFVSVYFLWFYLLRVRVIPLARSPNSIISSKIYCQHKVKTHIQNPGDGMHINEKIHRLTEWIMLSLVKSYSMTNNTTEVHLQRQSTFHSHNGVIIFVPFKVHSAFHS